MQVFIASGSNPLISKDYIEETKKVCEMLCKNNCTLVFGAYSKGMMGTCYDTFASNDQNITGVTLDAYTNDLINLPKMEVKITDTSFDRLKNIFKISDMYLFLPGGTGTFAELFGILEEFKTDNQNKKIILYNYNGFFNELLEYLNKLKTKGFVYDNDLDNLIIVDNINDLEGEIK